MISPVLAKKNGETLRDHTQNCLELFVFFKDLFPGLDQKCGYPEFYDDIATALFFHDFGKASTGFQRQFQPNNPQYHYRHEILSVPFVESLHWGDTEFIKELVLTHHKTLDQLSDYVEQEDSLDPGFADRLSEIKENLPYLNDLIEDFQQLPACSELPHKPQKMASLDVSKECWENVLRTMYRENRESSDKNARLRRIFGKGFVNSCDYMASAGILSGTKAACRYSPGISVSKSYNRSGYRRQDKRQCDHYCADRVGKNRGCVVLGYLQPGRKPWKQDILHSSLYSKHQCHVRPFEKCIIS